MPDTLTPAECEQRFWARYGSYLYGESRKPQSAQEWLDAARQLRGLQHLDELAERLAVNIEVAIKAKLDGQPIGPAARHPHPQRGDIYYDESGAPSCPVHERPLKQGRYGWDCSAKDPNGKNGYCDFRAKEV